MGLRHVRSTFILLLALILGLLLINNVKADGCCGIINNDVFLCGDITPTNLCLPNNIVLNATHYCNVVSTCAEGCCCLPGNDVGQYMAEYFCSGEFHLGKTCEETDCSIAPVTYTVTGTVRDISNNLVPGAVVNISPHAQPSRQITTSTGSFSFLNVNSGSCSIFAFNDSCNPKIESCYVSNSNINVNIILDDCCRYTCGGLSVCNGVNQSITCVATAGICTILEYTDYFPCSLADPCDWTCGFEGVPNTWSPCLGNVHTRECIENPPGWIGCIGTPTMPPESEQCDVGGFVTCGDGFPQPGEECDFNTTGSGDHFSTCTPPYDDDSHCTNDCRCDYPVINPDDCIIQHNPQEIQTVNPIHKTLALNITWQGECSDFINRSMMWYCHADSNNQCDSYGWRLINNSIPGQGPKNYVHYDSLTARLLPNNNYCYKVTTVYNNSVINPRLVNSSSNTETTCERLGDPECFVHLENSWCDIVGGVSTAFNCTQNTNILQSDPCTYGVCQIVNGEANCTTAAPAELCDSCNNVLGLFGYQYFWVTPTSYPGGFRCPSLDTPVAVFGDDNIPACYLDFTTSAVDKAYDCLSVTSCYDYKSRGSCQNDYCNKFFNGTNVNSNMCEWAWYDGEFNKGVCRPKEAFVASGRIDLHCDYCYSTDYNRIYPTCTDDVCELYGSTCFFNALNQCIDSNGITCGNYSTEGECIGVSPARAVSVNTVWSGSPIEKSGGTNARTPGNDFFHIGVCKWDTFGTTDVCFRDADNYYRSNPTSSLIKDCITSPGNRSICERDIQPPSTSISVNPSLRYGASMNLKGGIVNIYDNGPWSIGDDFGNPSHNPNANRQTIWMYYCINSSTPGCYPDTVLTTVSDSEDKRYAINLIPYGDINNAYGTAHRIYYFSEDPAKNLEVVKHFDFIVDLVAPNISLGYNMNTYPNGTDDPETGPVYWTDLSFNILLRNESSFPVSCFFNLSTDSPITNPNWGTYVLIHNIPSSIPPGDNELLYNGDSLNTTYYRLEAGIYDYKLTCYDAVGNNYTAPSASLNIDGDGTIKNPYPSDTPDTPITYRRNDVPKNMSINTTADGSCRYADQIIPYSNMIPYNWTRGSGPYIHIASNPKLSTAYGTGIYRFYTACNISVNDQYMILRGSNADIIYYAIDESPPKTNVTVEASANGEGSYTFNPYIYDANIGWDYMKITLNNIDSDPRLNASIDRDFGPNETFYCIRSNTNDCTNRLLFNKYDLSGYDSAIEFNYKDNGSLKILYGNRPTLCYYSTDKGENTENITCTRLNLRNLTFDAPIIDPYNTDTAYPTINVSYYENVTITGVTLIDNMNGISWQLYPNAPLFGQNFSFTTNYLPSETFTFTIIANDSDDNYQTNSTEFEITNPQLPIWLVSPPTGIGNHNPYEYIVGTPLIAHCKYQTGINPPPECRSSPPDDWIFCAYANATRTFDITGNNYEHTINSLYASVVHSDISIFCKINDTAFSDSNPASYGYAVFHYGYDTSPPVIILPIELSDNPLSDRDNHYVNITLRTDEPTVCHISGGRNDPYAQSIDAFFDDNKSLYVYPDYDTIQTYTIAYDSSYPLDQNFLFNYNIICYNYAQLTDSESLAINVNYTNDMIITKKFPNSNYIKELYTRFEVRTNNVAWNGCEYQLNTDPTNHVMTPYPEENPNYKNFSVNIPEMIDGVNTVIVYCHGGTDGSAVFELDVDTIPPNISISGHTSTCGLDGFDFVINSSDRDSSGINYISYQIYRDDFEYINWTPIYNLDGTNAYGVSIQFNDDLINNSNYTVYAKAYDLASNEQSAYPPLRVTALEPNAISCDFIPPVIEVTNITTLYSAKYNVSCSDNIACSDKYNYSYLNEFTSCADAPYENESSIYTDEIYLWNVPDGRLCIRVYDLNGNYDTAEAIVNLDTPECGNNVTEVIYDYYPPDWPSGSSYYEWCDGSDIDWSCEDIVVNSIAYTSGQIRCIPAGQPRECELDIDNCDKGAGWCGNNEIDYYDNDYPHREQCDGVNYIIGDWGNIRTCADFGFNTSGYITCNDNSFSRTDMCKFNTSRCMTTIPTPIGCGVGPIITLFPGEQCEQIIPFNVDCNDFDNFDTGGTLQCNDCMFDLSQCVAPIPDSTCGNGIIEIIANPIEECEIGNITECTSLEYPGFYESGNATCDSTCTGWDTDNCIRPPRCGDGVINGFDECDINDANPLIFDFGGFDCASFGLENGILRCTSTCDRDFSNCDRGGGYCGNNEIDYYPIDGYNNVEQCDGNESGLLSWGYITECADFGYDYGNLTCNTPDSTRADMCKFNTSQCRFNNRIVFTPSCTGGIGAILDPTEQCELTELLQPLGCEAFDNFSSNESDSLSTISCGSNCMYDLSLCRGPLPPVECDDGNWEDNRGEDCDASDSRWQDILCVDFNFDAYIGGYITCSNTCSRVYECIARPPPKVCGDLTIDRPNDINFMEECDGSNHGLQCPSSIGVLRCYPPESTDGQECTWDTSLCDTGQGWCGNDNIDYYDILSYDNKNREQCDGSDWGNVITSCQDFGFQPGGTLTCNNNSFSENDRCKFNTSQCVNSLSLYNDCSGNQFYSTIDSGEQCELWPSLMTLTCEDFDNLTTGEGPGIICNPPDSPNECMYDLNNCVPTLPPAVCGDGNIDILRGEQCEINPVIQTRDCTAIDWTIFRGGTAECDSTDCIWDTSSCDAAPVCGNGVIENDEFWNGGYYEMCDGLALGGVDCTALGNGVYVGGILGCTPNGDPRGSCVYDTDNCAVTETSGYCGDGIINYRETNSQYGQEQCDGANPTDESWGPVIRDCQDFGFDSGSISCNSANAAPQDRCRFNVSNCRYDDGITRDVLCRGEPFGTLSVGEQCDVIRASSLNCTDFNGYVGGQVTCGLPGDTDTRCEYNLNGCQLPTPPADCSNGEQEEGELCQVEGSFFDTCDSFTGGMLSEGEVTCHNCQPDASACQAGPVCGDGVIEGTELCDGNTVAGLDGRDCTSFGGDYPYSDGNLRCYPPESTEGTECTWDYSNCDMGGGWCGNNEIDHYYVPGIFNANAEQCDGNDPLTRDWGSIVDCATFGFDHGTLTCNPNTASRTDMCRFNTSQCFMPTNPSNPGCTGNDFATLDTKEQCEPIGRLTTLTCGIFDNFGSAPESIISCYGVGGPLQCTYNIEQCQPPEYVPRCNDGMWEPLLGEICDGSDPDGANISCVGFYPEAIGGYVDCLSECIWEGPEVCQYPPPEDECGDHEINYGLNGLLEECDTYNLNGMSCDSFLNWTNGTLTCYPPDSPYRCTLDTRNCNKGGGYCGDNNIDHYSVEGIYSANAEQCDGNGLVKDWGPIADCTTFGFIGNGTLRCNGPTASREDMCRFNTSQCINPTSTHLGCTNGPTSTMDANEQCEANGFLDRLTCAHFDSFGFDVGYISCINCKYDISGCVPPIPPAVCNNTIWEPDKSEECDYSDPAGASISCLIINPTLYIDGTATCANDCTWNTDSEHCILRPPDSVCGNGIVERDRYPAEVCDTDIYGNYVGEATCVDFFPNGGGIIKCSDDCTDWNVDNCAENLLIGYCGDNITNNAPDEQCDGTLTGGDWGRTITGCENFNFSTGGTLTCNSPLSPAGTRCMFNTSLCIPKINNTYPTCRGPGYIGIVTLDKGEQCEAERPLSLSCTDFDNFGGGTIQCSQDYRCVYDLTGCEPPQIPAQCGNGIPEIGEDCDGEPKDCDEFPGLTGPLLECNNCGYNTGLCTQLPRCGNDILENIENYPVPGQNYYEDCDGGIGNINCEILGYAGGGILSCYAWNTIEGIPCTFNFTNCDHGFGYCGDNITNNLNEEQCDGNNPATRDWGNIVDCYDFGYAFGGPLTCNNCQFDTSACMGYATAGLCGNPILNPGEQCEQGLTVPNLTCRDFDSFTNGTLTCGTYDNACKINIADCVRIPIADCGDGNITNPEDCEGTDLGQNPPTCQEWDPNAVSGTVGCYAENHPSECTFDFSGCIVPPPPEDLCNNGVIDIIDPTPYQPPYWEDCDMNDLGGYNCSSFVGYEGGILSCDNNCRFDMSNCAVSLLDGYCGDNRINNFYYGQEQCDGSGPGLLTWGHIDSCSDFNFNGGTLSCNPPNASVNDRCKFNTSACTLTIPTNSFCIGGPGGTLSIGEQCEPILNNPLECDDFDSFGDGPISCGSDCRYDISQCEPPIYVPTCNDGNLEFPELCDVPGEFLMTCSDYNYGLYNIGNVICSNTCGLDDSQCRMEQLCGNGQVDLIPSINYYEDCDGTNFSGYSCEDFGIPSYQGGLLNCNPDTCKFDFSNCAVSLEVGFCGDHEINDFVDGQEQCDGNTWGNISGCTAFGFSGGQLICNSPSTSEYDRCRFNTSACTLNRTSNPTCGGNTLTIGEQCDPSISNPLTCGNFDSFGAGPISCSGNCRYDISQCQPPIPPSVCGNNQLEPGEYCEGANTYVTSCYAYSGGLYDLGDITCSNCQANTSQCRQGPSCGNNIVEWLPEINYFENCDGSVPANVNCSLFGFDLGIVTCNPEGSARECMFNSDNCDYGQGYCGDHIVNNYFNEDCDGNVIGDRDWGHIDECTDLEGFTGGALSCTNDCQFDTSQCTAIITNGVCLDGFLNPGEDCEPNLLPFDNLFCTDFDHYRSGGILGCTYDCEFDFTFCIPPIITDGYCGNNRIDTELDEQCDGTDWGQYITRCQDFGYNNGTLSCYPYTAPEDVRCTFDVSQCIIIPDPICGDNQVNQDWEECDGTNLLGQHCYDFSGWEDGTLRCNADCTLDTSNCDMGGGWCGNTEIDHYPVNGIYNQEQCDGNGAVKDWGPINNCTSFGFQGGTLTCNNHDASQQDMCKFNTSQCINNKSVTTPRCTPGNPTAVLNPGEQCESDPNGLLSPLLCSNFNSFGIDIGYISCNNCMYDISGCQPPEPLPVCNDENWEIEKGEQCDTPGVFDSCVNFNPYLYISGNVICTSTCTLDRDQCVIIPTRECGNNIIDPNEECDGTNLRGLSCGNFGWDINWTMGTLRCIPKGEPNECHFDTSNCDKGGGYCGDDQIDHYIIDGIANWEQCDGSNPATRDWGPITSCQDLGFQPGGQLTCNPSSASRQDMCKFNTSQCLNDNSTYSMCTPRSSIAILDPGEQCEDNPRLSPLQCSNFNSFETSVGLISCNACMYDISQCVPKGYCGDGMINNYYNEQCDGTLENGDWGGIRNCQDINSQLTGPLSCYTSSCQFDISQCTSPNGTGTCGNGIINDGEFCEPSIPILENCQEKGLDSFIGGILTCNNNCTYNISQCQPPVIIERCGNGAIDYDYGEECDPPGSTQLCAEFAPGLYGTGNVVCTNTCEINRDNCEIAPQLGCGNGEVEPILGEECDGYNLGGLSCENFGWDESWSSGFLRCVPVGEPNECNFDTSNCNMGGGYCGNNKIDHYPVDGIPNQEQCDGNGAGKDWGPITNCQSLGFQPGGTLTCNNPTASREDMCKFNTSQCINNASTYRQCTGTSMSILDPGEQCEAIPRLSTLNCSNFNSFGNDLGYITCNACMYDISQCQPPIPPARCNDGNWEPEKGEQCDPPGTIMSCAEFAPELYDAGNVVCTNTCEINRDYCTIIIPEPICGNNILEEGEKCEPLLPFMNCTKFDNYTGGISYCNPLTCDYDLSGCTKIETICGDNYIDPGELCDGTNLGDVTNCVQLNPDLFEGGVPRCYPPSAPEDDACTFDLSSCVQKVYQRCGNGIKEGYEECDGNSTGDALCTMFDNYVDGILTCFPPGATYECMWDTSNCDKGDGFCGDNLVNNYYNEDCDGASPETGDWGSITDCKNFGFTNGTLRCILCQFNTSRCTTPLGNGTCGNGAINPGEQCEPTKDLDLKCVDFDHYIGGILECAANCQLDFTGCEIVIDGGYCGDNLVNDFPNEKCDGSDWGDVTLCQDFGFDNGQLRCIGCQFDTNLCYNDAPVCGDGVATGTEECDGTDLRNIMCSNFGFLTNWKNGILKCAADCTFDTSNCDKGGGYCGNNKIDHYPVNGIPNQEQCDGNNPTTRDWGPITSCITLGFEGGNLTCNNPTASREEMCKFNTSKCINSISYNRECTGNDQSILDPGEQCEAIPILSPLTCSNFNAFSNASGSISCNNCMYNLAACQPPVPPPVCNNYIWEILKGEECDPPGIFGTCVAFNQELYASGNVICSNSCIINTDLCVVKTIPEECGNNILESGEECEAAVILYALGCNDFDNFTGGAIHCNPFTCKYDVAGCQRVGVVCGDGYIDNPEQCDGTNLGNINSCTDLDSEQYSGGLPVCYPPNTANQCMLDVSTCIIREADQICGNGIPEGSEQCDGINIGTMSCQLIDNYVGGILTCNPPGSLFQCMWDTSKCDKGIGYCGDKIINNYFNEECDGDSPSTGDWGRVVSCIDLGFEGGILTCAINCQFNTIQCTTPAGSGICGGINPTINPGEDCEPEINIKPSCTIFDHYAGGIIACNDDCTFDTTGCELPITTGVCGDGVINDFPNEKCDGADWGDITNCIDFGFTGGILSCYNNQSGNNKCTFNTNSCTGTPPGVCGDSQVNPGEECEPDVDFDVSCKNFDKFTGGTLYCNAITCKFDVAGCSIPGVVCGDGYIDGTEQCDGTNLGQITSCTQIDSNRYIGGTPKCYPAGTITQCKLDTSECIAYNGTSACGNGLREGFEQCDSNVGSMDCTRIDSYIGGILTCGIPGSDNECFYDKSNCDLGFGYCGDNIINNFPYELCDGTSWGKITSCTDLGFDGGILLCSKCQFNTALCTTPAGLGVCNDQILNSGEDCEPTINLTIGCTDIGGFIGGTLYCGADCEFDIGGCIAPTKAKCGDGIVSGNERCDGTNLNDITKCSEYNDRYVSGDLSCNSNCRYNLTQCEQPKSKCGNNVTDSGEECDGDVDLLDCEDYDLANGELKCTSSCKISTADCEDPFHDTAICGNGLHESGEDCDSGLRGIVEEKFISLLGCNYGLQCSGCSIECAPAPLQSYLCSNLLIDEGETDMDCGGLCPPCGSGLSCVFDSDCRSGLCIDNVCAMNPCTNGLFDEGESDTDCGGSCEPCDSGMLCNSDNDCSSGKCDNGICVGGPEDYVPGPSTPGVVMLIVGILSTLGGGGYVIYKTYFDKAPKVGAGIPPISSMQQKPVTPPIDPRLLALQQQKLAQKKELQEVQRRSLLKGFDGESTETSTAKSPDDIQKWREKNIGPGVGTVKKQEDYVDISELKSKKIDSGTSEESDVFSKLSEISGAKKSVKKVGDVDKQTTIQKTSDETTTNDKSEISETSTGKISSTKKIGKGSKASKSRKSRVKSKSGAFTELDKISKDDETVKQKIIDFSGKSENKVNNLLKSSTISHEEASKMFDNMNKEKLLSDPFKDILSSLITSGKLSKQTIYNLLFEYMDQGVLSKKDVAKILSDLKAV